MDPEEDVEDELREFAKSLLTLVELCPWDGTLVVLREYLLEVCPGAAGFVPSSAWQDVPGANAGEWREDEGTPSDPVRTEPGLLGLLEPFSLGVALQHAWALHKRLGRGTGFYVGVVESLGRRVQAEGSGVGRTSSPAPELCWADLLERVPPEVRDRKGEGLVAGWLERRGYATPEEASRLKSENAALRESLRGASDGARSEEELRRLRMELRASDEKLRKRNEEFQKCDEELGRERNKRLDVENELKRVRVELGESKGLNAALGNQGEERVNKLLAQLEDLRGELKAERSANDLLEAERDAAATRAKKVEAELSTARKELEEAKATLDEREEATASMRLELENAKRDLRVARSANEALVKNQKENEKTLREGLGKQLEKAWEASSRLNIELEEEKKRLKDAQELNEAFRGENLMGEARLKEAQAKLAAAQKELESSKKTLKERESVITKQQGDIRKLNSELIAQGGNRPTPARPPLARRPGPGTAAPSKSPAPSKARDSPSPATGRPATAAGRADEGERLNQLFGDVFALEAVRPSDLLIATPVSTAPRASWLRGFAPFCARTAADDLLGLPPRPGARKAVVRLGFEWGKNVYDRVYRAGPEEGDAVEPTVKEATLRASLVFSGWGMSLRARCLVACLLAHPGYLRDRGRGGEEGSVERPLLAREALAPMPRSPEDPDAATFPHPDREPLLWTAHNALTLAFPLVRDTASRWAVSPDVPAEDALIWADAWILLTRALCTDDRNPDAGERLSALVSGIEGDSGADGKASALPLLAAFRFDDPAAARASASARGRCYHLALDLGFCEEDLLRQSFRIDAKYAWGDEGYAETHDACRAWILRRASGGGDDADWGTRPSPGEDAESEDAGLWAERDRRLARAQEALRAHNPSGNWFVFFAAYSLDLASFLLRRCVETHRDDPAVLGRLEKRRAAVGAARLAFTRSDRATTPYGVSIAATWRDRGDGFELF